MSASTSASPSLAAESTTAATHTPDASNNTVIEAMLDLEEIDKDLYRSKKLWVPLGSRGVFGGNVVGQALMAATSTVPTEFSVHSLHSYFLVAGDTATPILYHVERVRDGKSYCTRTVTAKQRGNNIFVCTVSFQVQRPEGLNHQYPMPNVPHHSTLLTQEELIQSMINNPKASEKLIAILKIRLEEPIALDFKDTKRHTFKDLMTPVERTEQSFWIKSKGQLGDALALHQCVVAYGSDHKLLNTAPLAHGSTWFSRLGSNPSITMMASLDHSMWFHCPFRADEWMLYVCETPRSGFDRGLTFGRIYREDGTLAVSVAQEGVVRLQPKPPSVAAIEQPKL